MRRTTLKNRSLVLLTWIALLWTPLAAQVAAGWDAVAKNDYPTAKKIFEQELKGPDRASALSGMSLVAANTGSPGEVFDFFQKFYQAVGDNRNLYLESLWSFSNGKEADAEVAFLQQLSETQQGTLQALAWQALGNHYYRSAEFKLAKQYFARVGAVGTWKVVGEFENISESGFHRDFGVLAHPEDGFTFQNKRGVGVTWFDIKAPRYDNWVDMEYYFYANNSVVYAQNFCNSPREQDVQFRLGISGSVKVWLNDKLVFQEAQERNNDLDTYRFNVRLMQGYNRILVQLGESEANACNFLLRITDAAGQNIPDLAFTTTLQPYPKDYDHPSTVVENTVEAFLLRQLETAAHPLDAYFNIIQYHIRRDEIWEARRHLRAARELYPDCDYLLYFETLAAARDNNATLQTTLEEEAKLKAPHVPRVLNMLYDDELAKEDYAAAAAIVEKLASITGETANTLDKRISLAAKTQQREQMFELIDKAYLQYPNTFDFVDYKAQVANEVNKNTLAAIKIWKKYRADNYNEQAVRKLAGLYFEINDVPNGLKTLEQLISNNPISLAAYNQLANIFFRTGNYANAEAYARECLRIAPYVSVYHETLAKSYSERSQVEKSIAAYEQAITYDPYNYDAREQLRLLKGKADVFANFTAPDMYSRYADAPAASDYPEDHSAILLHEIQKVVYAGGGSKEKHFVLIKVFNSSGVDYWKEYNIDMYDNQKGNIEKIEVLKQNGSRLSATNNGTHVVFSNLEPGDAIHLTYTLEDYYDGKLANHFWGTHTFATFLPVVQTRYGLITPQGMTYDWQVTNGDLQPIERTLDNEVLRVWEANNVPAIKYEPYMSNLADIAPVLHFSSFPDWDYIVQWYAELAQAKSKTDFEVESIATSLFKDTPDLTDREKVEKIYQYIVNEIRYRSVSFLQSGLIPQRASTTLSARQGDCKDVSTLFVALCNTQQIPANLVLVNTLDNGRQEMALPSINFNHCIAKVALEAETFFVELTSENLPFASLWAPGVDAFTLEIPADPARTSVRPSLLNPTNRPPDYTRRTARVTFDGATMYVDKQNQKSGVAAASMRDTYKNLGTVQQFKEMQQAVNTDFPGIKVTKVTFGPDLAANQETLGYEYAYEVPDAFSEVAGMRIFRLPWADNFSATDVISTSEREHPLETWQFTWSSQQEETLNIEIPEGMTLLEVPADESYTLPELTYNLTFRQTGNTLVATRKYEMLARKVDAARYADMKAALEKIIKADQKQVAFRAK